MSDVSSLSQACQRCYRRKQRCGREKPSCTECVKADTPCVARVWGRVLDSSHPEILDDAIVARSAIEQLKAKIGVLEAQQQATLAPLSQSLERPCTQSSSSSNHRKDGSPPRGSKNEPSATTEVAYLSVAAMGEPERQEVSINTWPSFSSLVNHAGRSIMEPGFTLSNDLVIQNGKQDLRALQAELVAACGYDYRFFMQAFLSGMNQLSPSVYAQHCHDSLQKLLNSHSDSHTDLVGLPDQPASILVTSLSVALGILGSQHYRVASRVVRKLEVQAIAILPEVAATSPATETVQYLLLASLLSLHQYNEPLAWHLLGLAITKAISAGLHRGRTSRSTGLDTSWLFWTLYKLDRSFATVLDRPFSIEDGDISLEPPQASGSVSPSEDPIASVRQFSHWQTHYAMLLSTWRRQPILELDACYASLCYWRESCSDYIIHSPRDTQGQGGLQTSLSLCQLTCRALVLLVYHFRVRSAVPDPLQDLKTDLKTEYVRLVTLYKASLDRGDLSHTILDAYDVFNITVAYIYNCQTSVADGNKGIGVSDMRHVSTALSLLRTMSDRLNELSDLEEVVWSMLTVLEHSEAQHAATPGKQYNESFDALRNRIAVCRVPLPRHVTVLLEDIWS
jgi:hypothetical protein